MQLETGSHNKKIHSDGIYRAFINKIYFAEICKRWEDASLTVVAICISEQKDF